MSKRQPKESVPQTQHFDLWRTITVWDWEGAETWEEVGAKDLLNYVGRFARIDDIVLYIEEINMDGLYRYCRFECPLNDQQEFAVIERFEGRWV